MATDAPVWKRPRTRLVALAALLWTLVALLALLAAPVILPFVLAALAAYVIDPIIVRLSRIPLRCRAVPRWVAVLASTSSWACSSGSLPCPSCPRSTARRSAACPSCATSWPGSPRSGWRAGPATSTRSSSGTASPSTWGRRRRPGPRLLGRPGRRDRRRRSTTPRPGSADASGTSSSPLADAHLGRAAGGLLRGPALHADRVPLHGRAPHHPLRRVAGPEQLPGRLPPAAARDRHRSLGRGARAVRDHAGQRQPDAGGPAGAQDPVRLRARLPGLHPLHRALLRDLHLLGAHRAPGPHLRAARRAGSWRWPGSPASTPWRATS